MFTLGIVAALYPSYLKTSRRFYLLWSVGFLAYGVSICIRAIAPLLSLDFMTEAVASGVPLMIGFSAIFAGLGDLVDKLRRYLIGSLMVPISIIVIYLVSAPETLGWVLGVVPYLLISGNLVYMRLRYKADVDILAIGWLFLLVVNVGIPFNFIAPTYGEVLAIIGKIVILVGIVLPKFTLLADDLKKFLLSGPAESYEDGRLGGIVLVKSNLTREAESKWIASKINDKSGGVQRTIFVTTHDLISVHEIKREKVSESDLYIVRMIHGHQEPTSIFQDKVMSINDDMLEFGILMSEVVGFSLDRKIKVNIILYNLSALIEMHDWKAIHKQLLTMVPRLKAAGVQLYVFFYPQVHEDPMLVEMFERLADEVVTLNTIY